MWMNVNAVEFLMNILLNKINQISYKIKRQTRLKIENQVSSKVRYLISEIQNIQVIWKITDQVLISVLIPIRARIQDQVGSQIRLNIWR